MLRRETGHLALPRWRQTRRPGSDAPATRAGTVPANPCAKPPRGSPYHDLPGRSARRAGCILATQPRVRPREPPFRLAFFIRPSYWLDIMCAWICAVKSMTTTTTISSEVPPK
jgi:hypothetical protein